jgi:alpha-glucosidase
MSGSSKQPARSPWWKGAVFYQIYPRSFADSRGDGVGDLPGILGRLEYLAWLGVDAIWISPFFRSPMKDYGYDVSDYCDVDPLFGSLEDFDRLLARAHELGLRVMIDWVPAHTSDRHPWFQAALASREAEERSFYVFRDPAADGGPPNNWTCSFSKGASAWKFDAESGQYFLHSFLPEQPDLDWHDPELRQRMLDTLRFWLDRGVDGFRCDVVHNIGKDPDLPDLPPEKAGLPSMLFNDHPSTHAYLREIRSLLDDYPGDRTSVGEVFLLDTQQVATYYGDDDELHMAFNFPPLYAAWDASIWRQQIEATHAALDPRGAWPTWVLSNHDQKRHRTRYGGSEARARAAAVLLLTLRGTPFLYQGEELGLEDATIPPERVVDPGGRDGCRAPIPWAREPSHGWPTTPWLPFASAAETRNVATQREDPGAILHLYRAMLKERRECRALRDGGLHWLDVPEGLLAYERRHGDSLRRVLINFFDRPIDVSLEASHSVRIASDREGEGHAFPNRLGPERAVVLEPGGDEDA